jgi:hypothetical protein
MSTLQEMGAKINMLGPRAKGRLFISGIIVLASVFSFILGRLSALY